jgi:ADP-ribose pyrophosphatase YjhB (NUDIX family)
MAPTELHVVTCFLQRADGRVLLLRRSERVGTYRGHWGGVAGYLEPGVTPEAQARTEIAEEVGLADSDVSLAAAGEPLVVDDAALGRRWIVHPFRFAALRPERVRIDWESVAAEWVSPSELGERETVPGLLAAWERVA